MHQRHRARELYELGTAMALAFAEPKRLKELIPKAPFDENSVPAMLRIPKRKNG